MPGLVGGRAPGYPRPGRSGGDDGRLGLVAARGGPVDPCRRPPRPRVGGCPPPRCGHVRAVAPRRAGAAAGREGRSCSSRPFTRSRAGSGSASSCTALPGTPPPPSERRRGGGTARLPCRTDAGDPPGPRPRRRRRAVTLLGRARRRSAPWPDRAALRQGGPRSRGWTSGSVKAERGWGTPEAQRLAAGSVLPERVRSGGVVLEYGGHTGSVVDLTDSAAVIRVGDARTSRCPSAPTCGWSGLTVVLVAPDGEAGAAGPARHARRLSGSGARRPRSERRSRPTSCSTTTN